MRTIATTTRAARATSSAFTSALAHSLVPAPVEEQGPCTFPHVEVEHASDHDPVVAARILGLEVAVEVRDGILEHRRSGHADAPGGAGEAVGALRGEEVRELFVPFTEDVHRERARGLDARP